MRWLVILAVLAALGVGIGSYAFASYVVLGKQVVGIDVEVAPKPEGKTAVGLNTDTDAVHLGKLHPGAGCVGRDVTVTNLYDVVASVVFRVKGLDAWVVADPRVFVLQQGEMGTTKVSACPPVDASFGNYTGFLVATFKRR